MDKNNSLVNFIDSDSIGFLRLEALESAKEKDNQSLRFAEDWECSCDSCLDWWKEYDNH